MCSFLTGIVLPSMAFHYVRRMRAGAKKLGQQSLFDQRFFQRSQVSLGFTAEATALSSRLPTAIQPISQRSPGRDVRHHQVRNLDLA